MTNEEFKISREDWSRMEGDLLEIKEMIGRKQSEELSRRWLTSGDVRKILGISQRTWQFYREKRLIPFCQIGRKIYVKMSDVEAFLESHMVPAIGV